MGMVHGFTFTLASALTSADLDAIRVLFRAYAASLPVDLGYQGFEDELAGLPGAYAPPEGLLLLARAPDGTPLGCGAFRAMKVGEGCEMKRVYIAPEARGLGLGVAMVEALMAQARQAGYLTIALDTLPSMSEAHRLYAKLGFTPIAPYYDTPVDGTVFLGRAL
jgi:GNAT superfamily N-acetyltransferase